MDGITVRKTAVAESLPIRGARILIMYQPVLHVGEGIIIVEVKDELLPTQARRRVLTTTTGRRRAVKIGVQLQRINSTVDVDCSPHATHSLIERPDRFQYAAWYRRRDVVAVAHSRWLRPIRWTMGAERRCRARYLLPLEGGIRGRETSFFWSRNPRHLFTPDVYIVF